MDVRDEYSELDWSHVSFRPEMGGAWGGQKVDVGM